jgi:hypothetical protein
LIFDPSRASIHPTISISNDFTPHPAHQHSRQGQIGGLPSSMGQKQQIRVETMPSSTHRQVLIVGGGTAGITVAAILKRRAPRANIAIVEPAHDHYYQPAFTLVGAGVYPLARTRRAEESLIPVGVQWIRNATQALSPRRTRFTSTTAIH